jgi:hypothetical protein
VRSAALPPAASCEDAVMRALLASLVIAGCSSSPSKPQVQLAATFDVTQFLGKNPSPLDPLQGQTISILVTLENVNVYTGVPGSDPQGCKSRAVWDENAVRTASGATADIVNTQILTQLSWWTVNLQICDPASSSSILIASEPDALNLAFGCPLPPVGAVEGGDTYPEFTSFTADHCYATILDVVNDRTLGNPDFPVTIGVSPSRVP